MQKRGITATTQSGETALGAKEASDYKMCGTRISKTYHQVNNGASSNSASKAYVS